MSVSCCLSAYDAEPNELHASKVVRARKEYGCCECDDKINPGERYERATGKEYHGWFVFATCLTCVAVRDEHDCGEGFVYGTLWESMAECYGYDVVNGDWSGDSRPRLMREEDDDPWGPPR